jgi:vacuolar iron transporter family protein
MIKFRTFSFGATTAIITSLALIVGLGKGNNAKLSIIGALLIIALADNIIDSLGMHIYQESVNSNKKTVGTITAGNFLTRLLTTIGFIILMALLPMKLAIIVSLILGLFLLAIISYFVAKNQKVNPYWAIFEHLVIAVLVIIVSNFIGNWINAFFR